MTNGNIGKFMTRQAVMAANIGIAAIGAGH
jgi:hypothetical protein